LVTVDGGRRGRYDPSFGVSSRKKHVQGPSNVDLGEKLGLVDRPGYRPLGSLMEDDLTA